MMKSLLLAVLLAAVSTFSQAQGTYREHIVKTLAAATVTGVGSTFDTGGVAIDYKDPGALVLVRVSAVSGTTPTLLVHIQCEDQPFGNLTTIATSESITLVGFYSFQVPRTCNRIRPAWTIGGGTPSFTFSAVLVRR